MPQPGLVNGGADLLVVADLAVRYGHGALPYLRQHKLNVAIAALILVAVSYGLSQVILRAKHPYGDPPGTAK
jgi:hypothetical protein